jgi:hypothetical protein
VLVGDYLSGWQEIGGGIIVSFFKGLLTARAHLATIFGLGAALFIAWSLDAKMPKKIPSGVDDVASLLSLPKEPISLRPTGQPLTPEEQEWAKIAWKYFENNYHPETGFVNSVDNYESTTLWDLGSYTMALLAVHDMGIIDTPTYRNRLEKLIDSLGKLPLVEGKLPNKAYRTTNLAMVDYSNKETPLGIGWSAIDIARLAVPLTVVMWQEPDLTPKVRAIFSHWKMEYAVSGGRLQGSTRLKDGTLQLVQEGRFGYEQYAAKSLFLLGADVEKALRYDLGVEVMPVSDQKIAYDGRLPKDHDGTHNAVLSEPYLLEAFEFGLTNTTKSLAESVYLAQENHSKELGKLVAVSEDNIDRAPYFVYNSVLNDRQPWAAFSPTGEEASAHRTLSVKAAVGWAYLFSDGYADDLRRGVVNLYDTQRGWFSGRYDADGSTNKAITANTNGILLEILWYRTRGSLLNSVREKL